MDVSELLVMLSQCKLGAVVLDKDKVVLDINAYGDQLLHGDGQMIGNALPDELLPLCDEIASAHYINLGFQEYVMRCDGPTVSDLPDGAELIVFRNATLDVNHEIFFDVLNHVDESIVIYDEHGRLLFLNDAGQKMEALSLHDIQGKPVDQIYEMTDGREFTILEVQRTRKPIAKFRCYYQTFTGRNLDVMCSTIPIIKNGQVLGSGSYMADWSTVDQLSKQIIDLQQKLTELTEKPSKRSEGSVLNTRYSFDDIQTVSPRMQKIIEQCKRVAKSDSSVMLYGETGTGKELFAQSIHAASRRANGPFLAINCAAIPENLLESLLFGTEKGAYTGAESRAGLFEQANGGTLLLDEINSMNISLQAKLLRVLQEGVVRRVGSAVEKHIDVRVLSNTNVPPYQAVADGSMRRDLFYRLGVVNISIPPMRERKEDLALLSKHYVLTCNKKLERIVRDISKETLEVMKKYDWPGNVRELGHAIEHAMNILPEGMEYITPEYLPPHVREGKPLVPVETTAAQQTEIESAPEDKSKRKAGRKKSLNSAIHNMEFEAICDVLRKNRGNVSKSARELGMSRQNLQYRIKRYQIDVEELLREDAGVYSNHVG